PGAYDEMTIIQSSVAGDRLGVALAADGARVAALSGGGRLVLYQDLGTLDPLLLVEQPTVGSPGATDADVDVAGDRVAVGHPHTGEVVVLRDGPGADDLVEEARLTLGPASGFGRSVALTHGEDADLLLAVGAPGS